MNKNSYESYIEASGKAEGFMDLVADYIYLSSSVPMLIEQKIYLAITFPPHKNEVLEHIQAEMLPKII
jgi:hypothetical protein